MMLSKHGLWKFVDGSAPLPSEEVAMVDYYEKEMKAFALLCEHLTDAQLAHIQYYDNMKSACGALCGVHDVEDYDVDVRNIDNGVVDIRNNVVDKCCKQSKT